MIKLAADENFEHDMLRALRRRLANLDVVRAQDAGLSGANEPAVLAWAAEAGRVLLTQDVRTITRYAYARAQAGLSMPGVFEASRAVPVGKAVEAILLIA